MSSDRLHVIIMGGSLGCLNAGLFLRDAGYQVTIFERSRVPLSGRGAGIVLSPATVRYFSRQPQALLLDLSVPSRWERYLDERGQVLAHRPVSYRFGSYNAIYYGLMEAFGHADYHLAAEVVGFSPGESAVAVKLASGRVLSGDLLVCADGIASTARQKLLGDSLLTYAGYIAWRGTAIEEDLSPQTLAAIGDAITYYVMPDGHVVVYPIPIVEAGGGHAGTVVNWLWYRNVPAGAQLDALMTDRKGRLQSVSLGPGTVRQAPLRTLRQDVARRLPPLLAELLLKTADPFIQKVLDCQVPRMVFGRICLIGDAAFVARPHAAAGTAKAAEDGYQLSLALEQAGGNTETALARWEPRQLELGRALVERARRAGQSMQDGTWAAGTPLPFGLYEVGDSVMP